MYKAPTGFCRSLVKLPRWQKLQCGWRGTGLIVHRPKAQKPRMGILPDLALLLFSCSSDLYPLDPNYNPAHCAFPTSPESSRKLLNLSSSWELPIYMQLFTSAGGLGTPEELLHSEIRSFFLCAFACLCVCVSFILLQFHTCIECILTLYMSPNKGLLA